MTQWYGPPLQVRLPGNEAYVLVLNHEGRGVMVARELLEAQPELVLPFVDQAPKPPSAGVLG